MDASPSMESVREGNIIMARLKEGNRLQPSILDVMEKHGVFSCAVLSGIGMLKNVTLGYYEKGKYLEKQYPRHLELLSTQGFVTLDSSVHLHVSLGDRDNNVIGGHLISSTIVNTVECVLMTMDTFSMTRKVDPNTGIRLLSFKRNVDDSIKLEPL